ncbi:hypothetical protein Tco_0459891 [Tanacetum coccineum]
MAEKIEVWEVGLMICLDQGLRRSVCMCNLNCVEKKMNSDRSDGRSESRLNIISCAETQKYIHKRCLVFLAHITEKKMKKKSGEKRLEDVPIVRDFLEDLPRLPPT